MKESVFRDRYKYDECMNTRDIHTPWVKTENKLDSQI